MAEPSTGWLFDNAQAASLALAAHNLEEVLTSFVWHLRAYGHKTLADELTTWDMDAHDQGCCVADRLFG